MKKQDIKQIVEKSPRERAALLLQLGEEMGKKNVAKVRPGSMPSALEREVIQQASVGPLLERLHGVKGAIATSGAGVKETGLMLDTMSGNVGDLVLTPIARKETAKLAMAKTNKDTSDDDVAMRQLAIGMMDNAPLPRICSAYAYWQATGIEEVTKPILANAMNSSDEEERILAALCLAKMGETLPEKLEGKDMRMAPLASAAATAPTVKKSMTVIIHGTFAKDGAWYRPGGDFHTYIKKSVYRDVYSGSDFYSWSGGYSLNDTTLKAIWTKAAKRLVAWCAAHPAKTLRLIAHSHGANVVNIATQLGLPACTLINLSIPVRRWNLPDISKVSSNRVFTIHSSIDLVVAVDGGAQNYRGTSIRQFEKERIIARFGHSDSHEEKPWRKKNIPALVKSVCP
jgi:hypothetical protein